MITKEDINKLAATLSEITETLHHAMTLTDGAAEKIGALQENISTLSHGKEEIVAEIEELQKEKAQLIDFLQKTKKNLNIKRQEILHELEKKPGKKPSDATTAIVDQFKVQTSIIDTISKPEPVIAMRQPIRDIAKAIAINDRFLFIRELFEGNATLFSQTVNELNMMNNLEDAKKHIQSAVQHWDETSEPAQLFLSIVQRRYL